MKIFIDEFLVRCDPVMRDVLCRRMQGRSWKEIGWAYRISSSRSVLPRFSIQANASSLVMGGYLLLHGGLNCRLSVRLCPAHLRHPRMAATCMSRSWTGGALLPLVLIHHSLNWTS